jgi:hypothetical protein
MNNGDDDEKKKKKDNTGGSSSFWTSHYTGPLEATMTPEQRAEYFKGSAEGVAWIMGSELLFSAKVVGYAGRLVGIEKIFKLIGVGRDAAKTGTNRVAKGLGSTRRTTAANLTEQLAMKEIMSNPTLGKTVMTGMKDSRWLGWNKMQYTHTALDGTKTTIHYVGQFKNGVLKAVDNFKFVSP